MAKIKATKNKAKTTETQKFIDTSSKEPAEVTIKKKITELLGRLKVNHGKAKDAGEKLNIIRQEGIELVGGIKILQKMVEDLEQ